MLRVERCAVRDGLEIDVDFFRQREHLADGERRVEVIIHGRIECRFAGRRLFGKSGRRVAVTRFLHELFHIALRRLQAAEARLRFLDAVFAEVERATVMRLEDEEAHDFARILLQDVFDGEEVVL